MIETAKRSAQQAVAVSFWLVAPYIGVLAVKDLVVGQHVETTVVGMVVTASSLVLMPVLGIAKTRLGRQLGSAATSGEGTQNLLCAAQAVAVLFGLAVQAVTGWDWVDPLLALGLAGWAVHEGRRAWRGEDCC